MNKTTAKASVKKSTEGESAAVEKNVKTQAKSKATKADATAAAGTVTKRTRAAKAAPKKPKVVTVDEMCKKLESMIDKKKAAEVKIDVAVDVKVWGWEDEVDRHFYIEIKNGALAVSPYEYNAASFEAYISYENVIQFLNGKLTLADAISTGALNANGNIPAALALGSIF